ncbi:family 16 glycosylhydrolase, partial [Methylobacterium sp. J-048]|uniref:glycoside hydrolase family 16 protein n=1 Tax=Methylobacterium sp. J-048 TaxID=2836635 RepID=UPI001FB8BCF0
MVDLTGYKLTFDDEFNTRSISQTGAGTTWADIRAQDRGDANADVGFGHSSFVDKGSGYDPFQVQNGALSITAVPDRTASGVPGSWESGLLTTQGNFSQTYGYFEVRADFSEQVGAWDAFWLLPNQQKPDPNNAGQHQELDVVERYGDGPSTVYSTIHTTDQTPNIPWQQNRQVTSVMPNQNGYHTYGMDWQADRISFYVDGQLTGSQATPSDLHSPMYMLVDLATQGGGSNNADIARTAITSKIDYVRAYSKDSSAVAVRQDTVSSPDGKDPGLYGATKAAAASTSTTATTTASAAKGSTSTTNPTTTTTGSAKPAATTTSAAPSSNTTGAATSTQSTTSSQGASNPITGSTTTAGATTKPATGSTSGTTNPPAGTTTTVTSPTTGSGGTKTATAGSTVPTAQASAPVSSTSTPTNGTIVGTPSTAVSAKPSVATPTASSTIPAAQASAPVGSTNTPASSTIVGTPSTTVSA